MLPRCYHVGIDTNALDAKSHIIAIIFSFQAITRNISQASLIIMEYYISRDNTLSVGIFFDSCSLRRHLPRRYARPYFDASAFCADALGMAARESARRRG